MTRIVRRSDITHVEAQGDYARLHTADGSHLLRVPLTQLETEWAPAGFVRIHRSLLVALAHVTELRMDGGRCSVRLSDGTELGVSRRQTRELRDLYLRRGPVSGRERAVPPRVRVTGPPAARQAAQRPVDLGTESPAERGLPGLAPGRAAAAGRADPAAPRPRGRRPCRWCSSSFRASPRCRSPGIPLLVAGARRRRLPAARPPRLALRRPGRAQRARLRRPHPGQPVTAT